MAIGDAAAAAGLDTQAGTQSRTQGARNHNQRGDELAAEIAVRAAAVTTLSTSKLDKANVFVQAAAPANIAGVGYSGRFWIVKA